MSDVVSASMDTLTRGQDHPGGVQVALCGESTVHAPESSHRQVDLGPLAQPHELARGLGEQPAGHCEGGALSGLLLVDCFVPEEPAPVPLRERRGFRLGAGAQTVGVTHCLEHMFYGTRWRCVFLVWMRPDRSAASCPAAGTTSGGTQSTGDPSSNAPSSGGSHKSSVRCARRRARRSLSSKRCRPGTPFVTCDPHGIHRLVKAMKGRSSRRARQEPPSLRSRLLRLWTNPYFVATVPVQLWRSSNSMLRTSPARRARPHLPTAKAGGFTGAFR